MRHNVGMIGIGGIVAASLLSPSISANAQQGMEEIVVTARKQAENLQQTPLAITAFTAETLEKANVRDVRAIANLTAGLTMQGDDLDRSQQPNIRGMNFTGSRGQEPNVAVMLDGVYIANSGAMSLGMMDFERVEIVKGPQSALYGHNAFAGAINYVTKAPPQKLETRVQFTLGQYGNYGAQASIGGTIVEGKLTARASMLYETYDGTWRDPVNSKKLGGFTKKDSSLSLRMTPNDVVTMDAGFYYGDDEFGLPKGAVFALNCNNREYCGEVPSPKILPIVAPTFEPADATGNTKKVKHARLKTTVDLDEVNIEVLAGYFDVSQRDFSELNGVRNGLPYTLTGTPAGTVNLPAFLGGAFINEDFSGEFRVSSPQSQELRWAFGGYLYDSKQSVLTNISINSDAIPAGRTIVCPGGTACLWLSPGGLRNSNIVGRTAQSAKQYSGYGSLEYDFIEDLTASVEGRWTSEKKAVDIISLATRTPDFDPDGPGGNRGTFKFWNPRFIVNYSVSDNHFLYASAGKGTKAGGFNQTATLADELPFGPEKNWTYELGSKNTFLDGQLRLNLAVFYVDWTDLQVSAPSRDPLQFSNITRNLGSVQSEGAEVDAAAKLADGVNVTGSFAYTDPRFGDDAYAFGDVALCQALPAQWCASRVVTNAPSAAGPRPAVRLDGLIRQDTSRYQFTTGVSINQPLYGAWNWFLVANYKYESKQYSQLENIRWVGSRNTLDAQIGIEGDGIRLSLWGKNMLNDVTAFANTAGIARTRFNDLSRVPFMTYPDKGRYGVTLDVKM